MSNTAIAVLMVLVGLAILAFHRPLARHVHAEEGAHRHTFGGLRRAQAVTLVVGAGFTILGVLVLTGAL